MLFSGIQSLNRQVLSKINCHRIIFYYKQLTEPPKSSYYFYVFRRPLRQFQTIFVGDREVFKAYHPFVLCSDPTCKLLTTYNSLYEEIQI